MLPCPECSGESRVLDSRFTSEVVRRRRECLKCSHRWSTFETNIDPRTLLNMGMMVRNAFERHANKLKRFSITPEEQKRLDARGGRHERKLRDSKIRRLYPTVDTEELANRLGVTVQVVKHVAGKAGVRKNRERAL